MPSSTEQLVDLGAHLHPQRRVEIREGLVEQEHLGLGSDGAGQGHALLLATREGARRPAFEAGEPHHVEGFAHPTGPLLAADAWQAVGHVGADVEVGEQRPVLEDHADAPPFGRHGDPVAGEHPTADPHLTGVGRLEPGDDAQQGGLTASAGAEQRQHAPVGHLDRHVPEHDRRAEGLGDTPYRHGMGVSDRRMPRRGIGRSGGGDVHHP